MAFPQRKLGSQGLVVPAIGLGCMGMTAFYGVDPAATEEASLQALAKAVEVGVNFLDTAWIYQNVTDGKHYTNEELVGKAIAKFGRKNLIIATKFGIKPDLGPGGGTREALLSNLKDSLARLGTDYIDLYYMHRMDPQTPIEETMQVLKELVEKGTIKYIGLSECSPTDLRRAHAVHPITAIQMEWSLQTRDLEEAVIPTARELGVGIVAYSPLGRGLLSATIKSLNAMKEGDWRQSTPRFSAENFEKNQPTEFFELAAKKGCTPAQLALAWVLARGPDVVPIPGSKSAARIEENAKAASIILSPAECAEIEASIPTVEGDRYQDMNLAFNSRMA